MLQPTSSRRHPFVSILLLFALCVTGAVVFGLLSFAVGGLVYGGGMDSSSFFMGNDAEAIGRLKILQLFSAIGSFVLPAFVFARIESDFPNDFLRIKPTVPLFPALIAILLFFTSAPLIEYTIRLNAHMKLPAFLSGLEHWMREQEDSNRELTRKLVTMTTPGQLSFGLLLLAIIPALGEELFFRGCLQQTFKKWFRNDHAAVWVTAIIFSAIHVQFFGFIPRMLLGALLGYLFTWGRSIWLPFLFHFANNGITVVGAYIAQRQGKSFEEFDQAGATASATTCIFSAVLTVVLLYVYWRLTLHDRS